jgi:AmmeMemoRadiSam system protein A
MGEIIFGGIMPHPPIMLEQIGGKEQQEVKKTVEAVQQMVENLKSLKPEVIVMITPHGTVFGNALTVNMEEKLVGDFSQFQHSELKYEAQNNRELAHELVKNSMMQGINMDYLDADFAKKYGISTELDHGVLVPLHFILQGGIKAEIIHINMGLLPFEELYQFGTILQEVIEKSNKKVAVIASGDLSHRLTVDSPAGYSPRGKEFDSLLQRLITDRNIYDIIDMPENLIEEAGECGLRPIIMLFGALDSLSLRVNPIHYESPYGVGYFVCEMIPQGKNQDTCYKDELFRRRNQKLQQIRNQESSLVQLARLAINTYILSQEVIVANKSLKLPEDLPNKAGTFVSIKKHQQLRGCIGTVYANHGDVTDEVIQNAINAATEDPRFDPITEKELGELAITVDVLSQPELVKDIDALDPKKYGVIVRQGTKAGLLLPDLPGINTSLEQVAIAKEKAGIQGNEMTLERFTVTRFY